MTPFERMAVFLVACLFFVFGVGIGHIFGIHQGHADICGSMCDDAWLYEDSGCVCLHRNQETEVGVSP